ncbi:MAG TPA: enolase C-terminal domain-like protein [Acidimicrobiia bacterium]|nr:enolase C-terminal domain-like protein [Acidimicrobiia bacterium]
MTIVAMDIFPIRLTLRDPIPMSSGVVSSSGNVVIRLTDDEGNVGWGEGVEAPAMTGQTQADIVADLERLRPLVVGADPTVIAGLWSRARSSVPSGTTATGAIDIALHDLVARSLGVPVHRLLGGAVRDRVPALALVGSGNPGVDAEKLEKRRSEGFTWFKVKLGMGTMDDEWGTLSLACDLAGADGVVCGDANEAWDEEEAVRFLEGIDEAVRFVEQPVPRRDHASLLRVAERSPVAICADESAGTLEAVLGLAGTAVAGVSLKLIKHGGITGVMRGAAICSAAGLEVNLAGKVIESSISAAANLHCAAAMGTIDFGCSPANQGVVLDVVDDPISVVDGSFSVPSGPGLGVTVDEEALRRLAG